MPALGGEEADDERGAHQSDVADCGDDTHLFCTELADEDVGDKTCREGKDQTAARAEQTAHPYQHREALGPYRQRAGYDV